MSNSTTPKSIADLFSAKASQAAAERKAGTIKFSELKKAMKEKNKKITAINDQCYLVLQDVAGDELKELQVKQHAELEVAKIEAEYKEITEQYNLYNVETAEAVATVAVEKVTKHVAPVTRGISQAIRTAKKSLIG